MHRQNLLGTEVVRVTTPSGWSTAGTSDENAAFVAPYQCKVTAVRLVPDTAITGDGTNYAIVNAENKGSDGTGTTEIATFTFDTPTTDDVAAFDVKALTLSGTAANLELAAGDVVSIGKDASAGTGMVVEGIVEFDIEPNGS